MRQEFTFYLDPRNDYTPHEFWMLQREPGHHYCKQVDFALHGIGSGPGCLLMVGSPLFELIEFSQAGWEVTFVDVRKPPHMEGFLLVQADASTSSFEPGLFDAASTTCVLCHAGMGRYGDPIMAEADVLILKNIARALKPGARLAVTFGPVASISGIARIDNRHRVYNLPIARAMAQDAGFRILKEGILDINTGQWTGKPPTALFLGREYLSMLLEKP